MSRWRLCGHDGRAGRAPALAAHLRAAQVSGVPAALTGHLPGAGRAASRPH